MGGAGGSKAQAGGSGKAERPVSKSSSQSRHLQAALEHPSGPAVLCLTLRLRYHCDFAAPLAMTCGRGIRHTRAS